MTIPGNFISTDSSVTHKASQSGKSKTSTSPSMHPSLPMSARTGRTTARYTPESNRRLCAGIVALSTRSTEESPGHHTHVLVTSSSRHPERFVLPKGGWEQDESAEHAALREGWEEGTTFPYLLKRILRHMSSRRCWQNHQISRTSRRS